MLFWNNIKKHKCESFKIFITSGSKNVFNTDDIHRNLRVINDSKVILQAVL